MTAAVKNVLRIIFALLLAAVAAFITNAVCFVYCLEESALLSYDNVSNIRIPGVKTYLKPTQCGVSQNNVRKLSFSLLGFIPLKTVDIMLTEDRLVTLGGYPVGLDMKIDGVLVDEIGCIETKAGAVRARTDINGGDIILALGGRKINCISDINEFMESLKEGKELKVTFNRRGNIRESKIAPVLEELSGKFKLGLWVKDTVTGVGTVSFVKSDGSFACLGHGITFGEFVLPCCGGKVYDCEIVGLSKGQKGKPGELKGMLKNIKYPVGEVTANTKYGVYGSLNTVRSDKTVKVGSRLNVNCGKAKIYTTVKDKADFYDIEIIRAIPQSGKCDKSMVIRVTDKRLIAEAGGIVQGMSGSPIIQNNRMVGVVTHVLVNDPTKGYGIYTDWMY